jgi:hypothetical protein
MTYRYTVPYKEVWPYAYIFSNTLPELDTIRDILSWRYVVTLKYTPDAYTSMVFLNGYRLMYRPWKFKPIVIEGCKLLFGTPLKQGWSNVHPYPTFEEWYCIIEAECEWLPNIEKTKLELISIKRIS